MKKFPSEVTVLLPPDKELNLWLSLLFADENLLGLSRTWRSNAGDWVMVQLMIPHYAGWPSVARARLPSDKQAQLATLFWGYRNQLVLEWTERTRNIAMFSPEDPVIYRDGKITWPNSDGRIDGINFRWRPAPLEDPGE